MSRVGLVLGAGGVTGDAFHRGVLRALYRAGYDARRADVIVGTSAGSMVGAFLRRPELRRAGVRGETVHGERLGRLPDLAPLLATVRRPWQARAGVVLTSFLPTGRRSTEFLVSGIRDRHGSDWPERPLYVCAVRRRDGKRVVFGRDEGTSPDLARAVAASCAIPGYFHPIEIDGEVYVDGGVHSPTNADVLRDCDLDVLIVSSPMSVAPRELRPTLDLPLRLHAHRYLQREVAPYRKRGTAVLTFEPGGELLQVMGVNPLHGARIDEIEKASYRRARAALEAHGDVADRLGEDGRRTA
ncbi:MAG TPA: patatin-like phospholipase family protein [Mycobacteriales bacterium]|nr:patatin-like phospholipase family protein [Mycobacteriales bacterium]